MFVLEIPEEAMDGEWHTITALGSDGVVLIEVDSVPSSAGKMDA